MSHHKIEGINLHYSYPDGHEAIKIFPFPFIMVNQLGSSAPMGQVNRRFYS
jgi:hypothetical protein